MSKFNSTQIFTLPKSLKIVLTDLCAALYAIGSYFTAYIQSPWGMGQFRPTVVIPALFVSLLGPWIAGIGTAIGTLICDSIKRGTLHIGSLIAVVHGNFIGFSFSVILYIGSLVGRDLF